MAYRRTMSEPRYGTGGRVGESVRDDPPASLAGSAVRDGAAAAASAALPLHDVASQGSSRRPSRAAIALALAGLFWLSFSLGWRALALPDEGRYVGVAWEMLRSGDWLIPTQNGLPFFHKPPLFYWITAASMHLFGTGLIAARLAPLSAAALGALGLHLLTRRWAGARAARWTTLVLLTLPFFFGGAQFANLDMLVAGLVGLAILLAAHASLLIGSGQPYRRALLGAWAAAALGVLAKGLIGVVLPGLVVLAWLILAGRPRTIVRLLWPGGPALFALIVAPWFIAVQLRYPGFAHFFFVYQQFERFTAGGFNNVQPWWFFLAVVAGLTLPWSPWLLYSTFGSRAGETSEATLWRRLMWAWLIVVMVFFSIPQSKPVGYAMPMLFPIAALCADAIAARLDRSGAGGRAFPLAAGSAVLAAVICIVTVSYFTVASRRDNAELARTLLRLRAPEDPVAFVGGYFFDVPLIAGLRQPVYVISDWQDPVIVKHDNWKRELDEARLFAPELATALLVDEKRALSLRCGTAPLWILATSDTSPRLEAIPGATLVDSSSRVSLWRIAPRACSGPAGRS
jgi:4-amino-4-deoxy-L-arabinose transferase-like glycosyltransferase